MAYRVGCRSHKSTVCVLFFLLGAFAIPLPGGAAPGIPWEATCPLTWELFRGTVPVDAARRNEPAAIHMTIHWHVSYSATPTPQGVWIGRVESATVTNTISPTLSWHVPGKVNAQVLRHEQGHFDLNEVYRCKLETALLGLQLQGRTQQETLDALREMAHCTAEALLDRLVALQSEYDGQTRHGNDPAAQSNWENRISQWLLCPAAAPS